MVKASIVTKVTCVNGLETHYKGADYPMKGYVTPEVLQHADIVKAFLMALIRLHIPLKTSPGALLDEVVRIGDKCISKYYMQDAERMACMKELDVLLFNFTFSYTSNEPIARRFSKIVSHLVEWDNAYRLRFIDICSETTPDALCTDPRSEIARILEIILPREVQHKESIRPKFRALVFILRAMLLVPKVKRAFQDAVRKVNWPLMQYDNQDKYWACLRIDYDFMGMDKDARRALLIDSGMSVPTLIDVVQ